MNPRNVIRFFRSPTGAFIGFCVLVVIVLVVAKRFRDPAKETKPQRSALKKGKSDAQVVESVERDWSPFKAPAAREKRGVQLLPSPNEQKPVISPISLYADDASPDSETKPLGADYAPYGRLIPCELVITIDSSAIRTPIIGLVTEDVFHTGRLIIPAGTEVHGSAQVDRMRERIASGSDWTLVWQTGEELHIRGLALDREKEPDKSAWGISDGSAGLRGRLIKSDDLADIKLFAATFLSGAASAMTEREQTVFGSQAVPSLQNAPFKGAHDVLAVYARQILETIQRDGFYVRVPAGKQFYLYATQTIDRSDAAIGGTRVASSSTNQVPDSLTRSPKMVKTTRSPEDLQALLDSTFQPPTPPQPTQP